MAPREDALDASPAVGTGRTEDYMTTKITATVMLMLTLSGCVNAESIDSEQCRSYGTKPGEPAYDACRTQLHLARTGRSCFGSCH
jgi:hypothetical protein